MPTVIDLRRGGGPEAIRSIGASIGSIISSIKGPDAADRKAFFKRIQDDPDTLNNFGKIARDNPGVLQQMFPFLKDEDIEGFRNVLPTLEDLREATERPGLTPVAAGGQLTPETATALGEAARAQTVGMTPSELAIEPKKVVAAGEIPQEAVTAGLTREVTGLTPGQTAQDAWNTEIFNTAMDAFNALEMEEADVAALRAKLPSAFFDEDNQALFEQRRTIAQMQIDAQNLDRANERLGAFQRSIGARWTERTKTGTPETWRMFLFTEGMNERGKGLAEGSILPQNQTDIRLKEVADAFARADQVDKGMEEAAIKTQIGVLVGRINRRDSEGKFANERTVRLMLLEQLNSSIIELANLTDGRVQLGKIDKSKMDVIPFVGPGNLPLTFEDTTVAPAQPGQGEIGQQRDEDVINFLDSLQGGEVERTEEIGPLNPQTVDLSQLSTESRNNLMKLANDSTGVLFQQLLEQAPRSAQEILNARRGR